MTTDSGGRSLRLELLATLAMVLVLAVVSLSLAAELLGQQRHRELEVERIREHASGLATLASMRFRGGSPDLASVDDLVQQALGSTRGTLAIELLSLDGEGGSTELASAGVPIAGAPVPTAAARTFTDQLAQTGIVVIDEPLPSFAGPNQVGLLRLTAQISPWTRSADWPTVLILAAGVALVLLVLGGLLLEIQVLRPLRALKAGVAAVARGEFDTRVDVKSSRELRELTDGFNEMTAALSRQHVALGRQATDLQRTEHMAAVGRLSAGVAHEVGNPLAALLGYTELLLDPRSEPALSGEQRELLERIQTQTQRIQNIVGQLLDYSRQRERSLVQLDLRETVEETVALLRTDPATKNVEIEILGEGQVLAWADQGLIAQVLLNLGLNACHAALAGDQAPRVQVALGAREDKVWLEVRDSGPGVPEQLREQIFEPFFTTRHAGEGTGLGLAISRGLVESLDGSLQCAEEASWLGGACFVIQLRRDAPPDTSLVEQPQLPA